MASDGTPVKGRRRAVSFRILTTVLNSIGKSSRTDFRDDPVVYSSQAEVPHDTVIKSSDVEDHTEAWLDDNLLRSFLPRQEFRPKRSLSCDSCHGALLPFQSPTRLSSPPSPSPVYLEVPNINPKHTPFPSPGGTELSVSPDAGGLTPTHPQQVHYLGQQTLFKAVDSPYPSYSHLGLTYPCPGSSQPSPSQLQEYHKEAAEYYEEAARYHRVQFNSPVATYFPISAENSTEGSQTPLAMETSITGSTPGNHNQETVVSQPAGPISPVAQDNMSASSGHTVVPEILLPKSFEGFPPKPKVIIRAKTPSFSSDSEDGRPEVYHGRSVSMNIDKGWEPDVRRMSRSNEKSSHGVSSVDSSTGSKPVFGTSAPPSLTARTLQVPDFTSHSRTASGNSAVTGDTTRTGPSGSTGTTAFLDQDELMERMLCPEQQVKNAENHVKAMQEALQKAFDDRKEAEKCTAVAEALLKSSLALRANERGETVLMELLRMAEEDLAVSQALLEKSRERAVASEERAINAEILVQRIGDNAEGSIKTLLHAAKQEARRYQDLYEEEKERAEKAEALQEEDRKWTVDADERAVFAEDKAAEVSKQLHAAHELVDELQVQLTRANWLAEKFKKEAEDAVAELTSTIQGHMDEADINLGIKNRLKRVYKQYNGLKEHNAACEAEFKACQATWDAKQAQYDAMDAKWQAWGDETTAVRNAEMEQQELDIEEIIYDRNLVIKTFVERIEQMNVEQQIIGLEELSNLVEWAKKEPKMKKGKEVAGSCQSIAIGREKARRKLEGLPFTPSLDAVEETETFKDPILEGRPVKETDQKASFGGVYVDPSKKLTLKIPAQEDFKNVVIEVPVAQTVKTFTYQAAATDPIKKGPFDFDGPARSALKEPSPVEPVSMEGLGLELKSPPKARLATIFEVLEAAKSRKGSGSSTSVSDAPPPTPPKDKPAQKAATPVTTPPRRNIMIDADLVRVEDGVVKLPPMTKGAWYAAMMASPKN